MTKDMTSGSPMKHVLSFTIPLIFGNLFQQFYSMVDTIIVGRLLGTGPLAAVGSTGSINFLSSVSAWASVPAFPFRWHSASARRIFRPEAFCGEYYLAFRRLFRAHDPAHGCAVPPHSEWMSTPAGYHQRCLQLHCGHLLGIPFIVFYNVLAGLLRAVGGQPYAGVFFWWPLRCSTSAWIFCWCWSSPWAWRGPPGPR